MAIDAGTLWEFRAASGSATNGGGYSPDVSGAGTDYSNQDSAEETYTTLATSGAGVTTVTCSGGDTFDANIIGNVINIASGTNHKFRYVQVLTRTSSTEITVDRAPDDGVGGMSSGVGSMGGALDIITERFFDGYFDAEATKGLEAYNTIYIKNDGTQAVTGNVNPDQGYVTIEGYNTTRGDSPVGSNRPAVAVGNYQFRFERGVVVKNLILTTSEASGLASNGYCLFDNCKSTNTTWQTNRHAFKGHTGDVFIRCEGVSALATAFGCYNHNKFINCYAHESVTGISMSSRDDVVVLGCIIDTCTNGVAIGWVGGGGTDFGMVVGSTFYNCTNQIIIGTNCRAITIMGNVIDSGTNGLVLDDALNPGSGQDDVYVDHNVWNNTTDVTNIIKGPHAITGDPLLTDPANGDFTLSSGSPAIDAGLKHSTDTGVVGTYKRNIGVDQTDYSTVLTSTGRQWMLAGAGAMSQEEAAAAAAGGSIRLINGGLVS